MTTVRAFRGFRFPAEIILWAVRRYLRFPLSYRDLEAMPNLDTSFRKIGRRQ